MDNIELLKITNCRNCNNMICDYCSLIIGNVEDYEIIENELQYMENNPIYMNGVLVYDDITCIRFNKIKYLCDNHECKLKFTDFLCCLCKK